jgi:hypothetical protein
MKRLFPLLVVSLLSAACGDAPTTSDVNVAEPKDAALLAAGEEVTLDVPYGGCPTDAQATCNLHHPLVETTPTAWCQYEACFEMSYGEEVKVVAADELGAFPKMWHVWHEGTMEPAGSSPCLLTRRGSKTNVEFPGNRCRADLTIGENLYYEHFASNPTNGCLAWLECKQR